MTLLHSPADVVRRLLIHLGLGTAPSAGSAWPVFCADEPNAPDNCVTVYDTVGRVVGWMQRTQEAVEYHGIQIRVRAATHPVGFTKASAIAVALDANLRQGPLTLDGVDYCVHSVNRTTGAIPLGKETPASKRCVFTVNALAEIHTTGA